MKKSPVSSSPNMWASRLVRWDCVRREVDVGSIEFETPILPKMEGRYPSFPAT